jgi:hypothetical protein
MLETIDLTTARPKGAPHRFFVAGPELRVQSIGGPITLTIRGEEIPISDPQPVVARDCQALGEVLVTHEAAPGSTVVIFYSSSLSLGKADGALAPTAELLQRWQGSTVGYTGGSLAALRGSPEYNLVFSGTSAVGDTAYDAAYGVISGRLRASAPVNAWGKVYPSAAGSLNLDLIGAVHPVAMVSPGMRTIRPEVIRLDIPVRVVSLVNTGVVGASSESRVHAGFGTAWNYYTNASHWPGPGAWFVTKSNTQTWKAVLAAANRGAAPLNRQEYAGWDTGISYLTPHTLSVQFGCDRAGAPLIQWAIDGAVVAERSGRLAALLNAADWTPWPLNQGTVPGVSCNAELLNDTSDTYYGFGHGIQLWRDQRPLSPGEL